MGLMVISGEMIDQTLGYALGISMMAAAALGNAFSNGVGMCLHGTIQSFADSLGLPNPHLTASQRKSAPVQYVNLCAGVFGVVTGCLIGMFPLNFMNSPKSHH